MVQNDFVPTDGTGGPVEATASSVMGIVSFRMTWITRWRLFKIDHYRS
jgi:hypothetical protein